MAEFTKIVKSETSYHIKDGVKRPLSIVRLRFHPTEPRLLGQIVDAALAWWDLNGTPTEKTSGNARPFVPGSKCCRHELGWIRGFDVAPSGAWLATGGSDRHLKLWRWAEGKPEDRPVVDAVAHEGWVEAVAFSPDGKLLASAGSDHAVKLWDATNLRPIRTLAGHSGYVRDLCWAGPRLISGAEDGKAIVWDTDTGKDLMVIDAADISAQQGQTPEVGGVHRLSVSRDGRWLAAAGAKRVSLFALATGEPLASDPAQLQAAFHPKAEIIALGDETVRVCSYAADKFAPAPRDKNGRPAKAGSIAARELGSVKQGGFALGLAFDPEGQRLALGQSSGSVDVWQLA